MAVEPAARRFGRLGRCLDERQRRLLWAVEAAELGRGGTSRLASARGAARSTIEVGMLDLADRPGEVRLPLGRSRRGGAGRKQATVTDPKLVTVIDTLVDVRGDCESLLRWTRKSTRQLADAAGPSGHTLSSRN